VIFVRCYSESERQSEFSWKTAESIFVGEVPTDLPKVQADGQRIEQVILNLLSNAMRYMPEGGTIRIAAQALEEQSVRVSVCKTGQTLSEEDLVHILTASIGQSRRDRARKAARAWG